MKTIDRSNKYNLNYVISIQYQNLDFITYMSLKLARFRPRKKIVASASIRACVASKSNSFFISGAGPTLLESVLMHYLLQKLSVSTTNFLSG